VPAIVLIEEFHRDNAQYDAMLANPPFSGSDSDKSENPNETP
jgi:type I restriction-modification system DNA methylase subunit